MSARPRTVCATTSTSYVLPLLPTLHHAGEHPPWDHYLKSVYGAVPASAYPIALSTFGWFYHRNLPMKVQPAEMSFRCRNVSAYGHAWTGPAGRGPGIGGQAESSPALLKAGFFVQHHTAGRRRTIDKLFGNHSWVEVMRATLRAKTEIRGSWYFHARGSGIWCNTGRSIVGTNSDTQHNPYGSVEPAAAFFRELRRASPLRTQLYSERVDSIQFASSMLFPRTELVDIRPLLPVPQPAAHLVAPALPPGATFSRMQQAALGARGGMRCACADHYRSGWDARRPCYCTNAAEILNCGELTPPSYVRWDVLGRLPPADALPCQRLGALERLTPGQCRVVRNLSCALRTPITTSPAAAGAGQLHCHELPTCIGPV